MVEVDKERGRIGLRLSDDPDVEGKSAEELAGVGTGDPGRPGAVTAVEDAGAGARRRRTPRGARRRRRRPRASRPRVTEHAQVTELDSGIRVVTEAVPSVRSVALGLWVRTGSRDETPAQAGVSHFLEHLLFKGRALLGDRDRRDLRRPRRLGERRDRQGVDQPHARFLDTHTEEAFDLLAEMLLGPTYPEIDSEREVVLEEIAMYEDEPQDKVHDVLDQAVFGGHPLGRRVLGGPR